MLLYIWIAILIVSIVVEVATINLVSVWFAIGAVVAIIAELLGVSVGLQITLFIIISAICITVTRPLAKKYLKTNIVHTNYERIIGKHGIVTKSIDANTKGEVKVMSTIWAAAGINNTCLEEGDYCEILAVEGVHVIVKKIERED